MSRQQGFTITELMFAMAGVAVLLIILLGATIQLTRTYNKGITLKRVNQSGRTVGDELQRIARHAPGVTVTTNNRMCFGGVSLAWVEPGNDDAASQNRYNDGSRSPVEGLVKVDENLCDNPTALVDSAKATRLLDDGLVVRQLKLNEPTPSQKLIRVQYIISTPGEDLIACSGDDDFCALNRFDLAVYARGY